jgi:hypothetical protein
MKIEGHKRSILVSGSHLEEYETNLKRNFQAKTSKQPKGLLISKKHTNEVVAFLRKHKVRLYIDEGLKTGSTSKLIKNVSVRAEKKVKTFKPMSEPLARFYISAMFQKPNSSFAKNQLRAQGYTKAHVVSDIEKYPFEKRNEYLKTINKVW